MRPNARVRYVLVLTVAACAASSPAPEADTDATTAATAASTSSSAATDASTGSTDAGGSTLAESTGADSSSGGASTSDAGSTEGSSTGDPAVCTALLCDDFESGELDPTVWTGQAVDPGNAVLVQSERVAHGQHALRFHFEPGTGFAQAFVQGLPAALSTHLFGRMYMYLTPDTLPGHTAIVVGGKYDGYPWEDDHLELTTSESGNWGMLMWSGSDGEAGVDGGAIATGQWACVEWEFSDEPDSITVWVDGVELGAATPEDLTLMGQSSGLVGGFDSLQIGLRSWHSPDYPMELDVDDFAIDVERIGCLP